MFLLLHRRFGRIKLVGRSEHPSLFEKKEERPHLSLDTPHLFIPLEFLVKLAHAGGADSRRGERTFDVGRALLAGVLCGFGAGNVLELLTLVFSDAGFAGRPNCLYGVMVDGCRAGSGRQRIRRKRTQGGRRTLVRLDLVYPLCLLLLVLPRSSPPIDPRLFLFVPDLAFAAFFLDTFGCGETFPFRGRFGHREGFSAREGGRGRG